jgi:hypothetical protein
MPDHRPVFDYLASRNWDCMQPYYIQKKLVMKMIYVISITCNDEQSKMCIPLVVPKLQ